VTSQGQRFRRRALRHGYKCDEVDTFLDRVEATLNGERVDAPVRSSEVHDVVFRVRFGGYDEWQVDLHLDRIERQLAEQEGPEADRGPERMLPDRMPERMPERLPERMPERLPERVGGNAAGGAGYGGAGGFGGQAGPGFGGAPAGAGFGGQGGFGSESGGPGYGGTHAGALGPGMGQGGPGGGMSPAAFGNREPRGAEPPRGAGVAGAFDRGGPRDLPSRDDRGGLPARPGSAPADWSDGGRPGFDGFAPAAGGRGQMGPGGPQGGPGQAPAGPGQLPAGPGQQPAGQGFGGPPADRNSTGSIQSGGGPLPQRPSFNPDRAGDQYGSGGSFSGFEVNRRPRPEPTAEMRMPDRPSGPPAAGQPGGGGLPAGPPAGMPSAGMPPRPGAGPGQFGQPGQYGQPGPDMDEPATAPFSAVGPGMGQNGMGQGGIGQGGMGPGGMGMGPGAPAGPGGEIQRIDQLRRTFQIRRFGSGYDRMAVDRLFESLMNSMTGRSAPIDDSVLEATQFNLVPGGYFEAEVDQALREVRDIMRRW